MLKQSSSDVAEKMVVLSQENTQTIVMVSHVVPYPPMAGNEYYIYQITKWLESFGYRVILVICPLPGDVVSKERIIKLSEKMTNFFICLRDGSVTYQVANQQGALALQKEFTSDLEPLLIRFLSKMGFTRRQYLRKTELTFCPSVLVTLMKWLALQINQLAIITNYVWMTRYFCEIGKRPLKMIFTHDVFSTKKKKVLRYGIEDALALSGHEERQYLLRGDVIVAIQPEEAAALRNLAPERPVITIGVGYDFEQPGMLSSSSNEEQPSILFIGSDNSMNQKGLNDFLENAWPGICRAFPTARFIVAGKVGQSLRSAAPNTTILGVVENLSSVYAQATLVINPCFAGTGLKVKTVEALAYGRRVASTPAGLEGLPQELRQFCLCAEDWPSFERLISDVLSNPNVYSLSEDDRRTIREHLSQDRVYGELLSTISDFFRSQLSQHV